MGSQWQGFWGKFDKTTGEWLPLVDHSADVAACAEAILERTLLGRRLARVGGLKELHPGHVARLGFLAALHDFGKLGVRFQRKVLPGVRERAGHVKEALQLLDFDCQGFEISTRFYGFFPGEEIGDWGDDEALFRLVISTVCHHGRPYRPPSDRPDRRDWEPARGIDPFVGLAELVAAARRWFPGAFDAGVPALPAGSPFQHAWNGILCLADWLGSNRKFFPFDSEEADRMAFSRSQAERVLRWIGLDTQTPRTFLSVPPDFAQLSTKGSPRDAQAKLAALPVAREGSVTVLEAATGAGKTEAALWHYARLFQAGEVDGLYFALPTRTAATQICRRIEETVKLLFGGLDRGQRPPVVQAVPGYLRVDGQEGRRVGGEEDPQGRRLPAFEVQWDDEDPHFRRRAWAAEHGKRYLAGAVVAGTVDQVLLSALSLPHAHLRASCLLRHLLVVDEVHASDAYMSRLLEEVLEHHRAAGGHALLLSATLGSRARHRFLHPERRATPPTLEEALAVPYPAIHYRPHGGEASLVAVETGASKSVEVDLRPLAADPAAVAALALEAAERGARVLVIRNTVTDCRAVQQALEELAAGRGREDLLFGVPVEDKIVPAPHHGRFAPGDRKLLDAAIEEAFSPARDHRNRGVVAVATQTVEQSLDIDGDLLITDLCPMDVLLQRIGRLHRHAVGGRPKGFETARVVVLTPASRNLAELLQDSGTAKGLHGLGGLIYEDLRIIEATWRLLEEHGRLEIPAQCRELVERASHDESLRGLEDLPEPTWLQHEHQVTGKKTAETKVAGYNVIPWTKKFGDFDLAEPGEQVQTRLGERDLILRLPSNPLGPFGQAVPQVTLKPWQLPKGQPLPEKPEAEDVEILSRGGFRFLFMGKAFDYGRWGLSALKEDE